RSVHEHEPHAKGGEQIEIVREIEEAAVGEDLATEGDHEPLAAERVDVGCDRLEPVDEAVLGGQAVAAQAALNGLALRRRGAALGCRFLVDGRPLTRPTRRAAPRPAHFTGLPRTPYYARRHAMKSAGRPFAVHSARGAR